MQDEKKITVISNRRKAEIEVRSILYILMKRKIAEIHVSGGDIFKTRTTLSELVPQLDERFMTVRKSRMLSPAFHAYTTAGLRFYGKNPRKTVAFCGGL